MTYQPHEAGKKPTVISPINSDFLDLLVTILLISQNSAY